jgi:hypothetical protein
MFNGSMRIGDAEYDCTRAIVSSLPDFVDLSVPKDGVLVTLANDWSDYISE